MRVSPEDLKRYLDGHRAAAARLREETLRRLRSLSVEEAREEYDSLCRVWELFRAGGDQSALDRQAIRRRIALRRRLGETR